MLRWMRATRESVMARTKKIKSQPVNGHKFMVPLLPSVWSMECSPHAYPGRGDVPRGKFGSGENRTRALGEAA
jgi:hypothetical protein